MSQLKNSYSYDAPSNFINFISLDDEDSENIDSWFDEKANLENRIPGNQWARNFQSKTPLKKTNLKLALLTPLRSVDNTSKETDKEKVVEEPISSNSCSFLKVKGTRTRDTPAQPQRRSIRLCAQKDLEQKENQHIKMKAKRCATPVIHESPPTKKMKVYKFKTWEFDPKIFESGPNLPKVPVKPPTQPVGFDLEIEKRIQERASKKKSSEDKHFEFHSRPCPSKILEDVVGVPEKKVLPLTVPKSPAFVLKNRMRILTKEDEEEQEPVVIRVHPMPHYGVPFKPQNPETRTVEIRPFSFDSRDKERQLQKEKKIQELLKAKEMPKFKAHPMPYFDAINLPEKKVKNATQVEPFSLETDKRGALRAQTCWKYQLEEEQRQQKEATCFKAGPNNITSQEPFVPKNENKNLTVQEPFQFATERRAKKWQELKRKRAEFEAMKAQLLEEIRQEEEEQEKEELARIRKTLVHKANPIRKYQSVEIKPSDKPLTVPISPSFSTWFQ